MTESDTVGFTVFFTSDLSMFSRRSLNSQVPKSLRAALSFYTCLHSNSNSEVHSKQSHRSAKRSQKFEGGPSVTAGWLPPVDQGYCQVPSVDS